MELQQMLAQMLKEVDDIFNANNFSEDFKKYFVKEVFEEVVGEMYSLCD